MNVFLTGATGLLGINTIDSLLRHGHSVLALVRDTEKAKRVLPTDERITLIHGDLENAGSWIPRLADADALIHTAAYFREYFGRGDHAPKLCEYNVELPVKLVHAAEKFGLKKTIMVSSSLVVPARANGSPSDETDAPNIGTLENDYGASKVEMERAFSRLTPNHPLIIVRPGWMFGPNDYAPTAAGDLMHKLLKTGMVQLVTGSPLCIVDARDVAQGMVLALEKANISSIYNLAGNCLTAGDALKEVSRQAGRGSVQLLPVPMALGVSTLLEPFTRLMNIPNPVPRAGLLTLSHGVPISSDKAKHELGVTFRPFSETARDSVAFHRRVLEKSVA